jgi:uncharacterized protein YdiU (UPF0061 family)
VQQPKLELWNKDLAESLGIDDLEIDPAYFSGNKLFNDSIPMAQAYAGHQFGHSNMLGDGRAILLGEHRLGKDLWDIQLKGSGPTKYSRGGDGRATLSSVLREYLYSEAMYGLQISTTRSLCIVSTGEEILREKIYEGGILTRVSKGHLRVGTLEYAMQVLSLEEYKKYLSYLIRRFYPHVYNQDYLSFFKEICQSQIKLVVDWMRVGFIHGVMNTDNVSLCGETIDYGPCAFMNAYNPSQVYSQIDRNGRYAYGKQPEIMHWNMAVLANCMIKVVDPNEKKSIEILTEVLHAIPVEWQTSYQKMMHNKLGLVSINSTALINELLDWMHQNQQDYTSTFLQLMYPEKSASIDIPEKWLTTWKQLSPDINLMKKNNPIVIPRNLLVDDAINSYCEGDKEFYFSLLQVVQSPYSFPQDEKFMNAIHDVQGFYTHCNT